MYLILAVFVFIEAFLLKDLKFTVVSIDYIIVL